MNIRRALAGSLVLLSVVASAQDTRKKAPYAWDLASPVEGRPCPSHESKLDAPKELVFGVFELVGGSSVTDGDTIRIKSQKTGIRLIGLDAEETFKDKAKLALAEKDWAEYVKTELAGHDVARPPKYGTPMGEAAKDAAKQLLHDLKEVRLEWDDVDRKIDGFDRSLCLVLFQREGRWINLNVEMVRQGLSPYFVKYGRSKRRHEAFDAAQKEAQEFKRGIWGTPPKYHAYDDYAIRLKWWAERDAALAEFEALRKTRTDLFALGQPAEWDRLRAFEGKKVTVFGTSGDLKHDGDQAAWILPHMRGQDFKVIGPKADAEALPFKREEGNLLYVSGTLRIVDGRPAFRTGGGESVSISRKAP